MGNAYVLGKGDKQMNKYFINTIQMVLGQGLTDQLLCAYMAFIETNAFNTASYTLEQYVRDNEPELNNLL